MDFEIAAQRLANDQKSALARSRASRNARAVSSKARREAAAAKANSETRLREKKMETQRNAKIIDNVCQAMKRVERKLGSTNVVAASSSSTMNNRSNGSSTKNNHNKSLFVTNPIIFAQGWKLQATSIHGEGDKIALPPSILETLTSSNNSGLDPSGRNGRPLAFRIGVLDPEYAGFPASEKMKAFVDSVRENVVASEKTSLLNQSSSMSSTEQQTNNNDEVMSEDSDDDNDTNDETSTHIEAYLDELSHRYISYTHGTVVEFTQEDGCVGLPEPIARALLQQNSHSLGRSSNIERHHRNIPIKRTVDPASTSSSSPSDNVDNTNGDNMDIVATKDSPTDVHESAKTPGHLAYGAFDIPDLSIEITPINCLPAGTDCTFTPTASSIKNGFYNLKDVKAVLEQSLMRTRATLSKGDVIRTWRRGVSFDLIVSSLSPSGFGVVSCVNTDLNVDIGPPDDDDLADLNIKPEHVVEGKGSGQSAMGKGRLLSEDTQQKGVVATGTKTKPAVELAPEPADDKVEGVCNIQIRGQSTTGETVTGRRRFETDLATMNDLFQYVSFICGADPKALRLVTRFPRRVFTLSSEEGQGHVDNDATLKSVGLVQGQELFMIEYE